MKNRYPQITQRELRLQPNTSYTSVAVVATESARQRGSLWVDLTVDDKRTVL